MPSLEKPCLLLPHDSERSTVYLCVPVDPSLATKSSVIETLIEFDGFVELPEGVSFDDFEAWSSMITRDPFQLNLDELSFALQVGGRLSAQNTTQLAAALAAKLAATSWNSSAQKESMMRALLPLSKDMQQLVFTQWAHRRTVAESTLLSWPVPLQQAYADRWVSPGHGSQAHEFCIHHSHDPATVLAYLSLLSRTDPSLPGLTTLNLDCVIRSPEAASLCSSALLHHPALQELDMPYLSWEPSGPSPAAAAVLRTLPQLTAITCLTLSAPSLPSSPPDAAVSGAAHEAVQVMAAAISALPSLKEFCLCSMPDLPTETATAALAPRAVPPAPKRPRIAACMGPRGSAAASAASAPPSFRPVFAALSAAPALAHLSLCISAPMFHQLHTLLSEGGCGHFQFLKGLTCDVSGEAGAVESADADAAARLAAVAALLAAAPLGALECMEYVDASSAGAADSEAMRAVYRAAASHPALKEVEIQLGPNAQDERGREARSRIINGDTWGLYVTTGTASVPHNFTVQFCIAPPMTDSITGALSASLLSASLADVESVHVKVEDWSCKKVFKGLHRVAPMLQSLAALTHLQSIGFALQYYSDEYPAETSALCDSFLEIPLQSFRLLTHLSIDVDACKHCETFVQRLPSMSQLQSLTVGELECFSTSSAAAFEACFAPLTALTHLRLHIKPLTADLVRAFSRAVKGMLHLRYACIDSSADDVAVDWFQGLLDLPRRGAYQFGCWYQRSLEGGGREVLQQLIKEGARLSGFSGVAMSVLSAVLGQMLRVHFSCAQKAEEQGC